MYDTEVSGDRPRVRPGTMTTVFIIDGALVVLQVVLAVILIGMYIAEVRHPVKTDSYVAFALFGGIILLFLASILGGMMAALSTHSSSARIVYTVVIAIGVLVSFVIIRGYAILPNLLLITTLILVWLPDSAPFFSGSPDAADYQKYPKKVSD